eukprot:3438106-Heterocapsa_arctica.AAC.1
MKLVFCHVCSVFFVLNWFVVMNPAVRPDSPVKKLFRMTVSKFASLRSRWLRRRLLRDSTAGSL